MESSNTKPQKINFRKDVKELKIPLKSNDLPVEEKEEIVFLLEIE